MSREHNVLFSELGLPPEIMTGVRAAGFQQCTPIQAQTLPVALQGKDIAGQAQTGTGKTRSPAATSSVAPKQARARRRPS